MLQGNTWTENQVLQLLNMEELQFKNCQSYSAYNDLLFSSILAEILLIHQPGYISDFSFCIVWISNGHSYLLCHSIHML